MRHRQVRWIMAAGLALLMAPAALSAQDLTLKGTTTANGKQTPTVTYIGQKGTRTAMGDGTENLLRLDQKKIYVINMTKKTYTEMTFEDLQKMADTANAAMKDVPPEAAAMMKKMGMGGGGGDATVTKIGPGGTIAGYPTEQYRITLGSTTIDEWLAPGITFPEAYYVAMRAFVPSTPMLDMKKLYEELGKLKGVPLKSVMSMKMMGREMTSTTEVTAVDKTPIPAEAFEVPAGFKKVDFKQ